jgi:hypothetical protein
MVGGVTRRVIRAPRFRSRSLPPTIIEVCSTDIKVALRSFRGARGDRRDPLVGCENYRKSRVSICNAVSEIWRSQRSSDRGVSEAEV